MAGELLIPTRRLCSISFSTYSADEIKKISCKRITNVETFDSLMHPNPGGLYDIALGPGDKVELCGTCGLNYVHCPGHMGDIQLPLPVYHPVFFSTLYKLLRCTCFNCCRLLAPEAKTRVVVAQLRLLESGYYTVASTVEDYTNSPESLKEVVQQYLDGHQQESNVTDENVTTKHVVELRRTLVEKYFKECAVEKQKCPHCGCPVRKLRQHMGAKIFHKPLKPKHAEIWVHMRKETNGDSGRQFSVELAKKEQLILPVEAQRHLERVWENNNSVLSLVFGHRQQGESAKEKISLFFLTVVPVPPSRFRPVSSIHCMCVCVCMCEGVYWLSMPTVQSMGKVCIVIISSHM